MAHALSTLRLLLAVPLIWSIGVGGASGAGLAAALFVLAIATDLLDGHMARRLGTASAFGRALDHGSDVVFVCGGLFAAASRGLVPWPLPVLIAFAFAQYAIDSYLLHRERELRMSALGRWNGILYFVPLGGAILVLLGADFLAPLLVAVAWLLVASTVVSIADRLMALGRGRGSQTARGSRDARR
jgi:CDP-diacylglycerol--glycerol-3-phosphate 3-phosphatidyltransferase